MEMAELLPLNIYPNTLIVPEIDFIWYMHYTHEERKQGLQDGSTCIMKEVLFLKK